MNAWKIRQKYFCTILLAMSVLSASILSCSLTDTSLKPDHYGVFFEQNGILIELQEQEIFNIPVVDEIDNVQTISDAQPIIIIWRSNTNLDYLEFLKLNQYLGLSKNSISYNATHQDDGIIEITPKSTLEDGVYCLIQGDPLAATSAAWCFMLGAITEIQIPSTQTPILTTTTLALATDSARATFRAGFDLDQTIATLAVTAGVSEEQALATWTVWEDCFLYEGATEYDEAIRCYQKLSDTDPDNFKWRNDIARLYAVNHDYLKAIEAGIESLEFAKLPQEKIDAHLGIGVSYYQLGEYDLAIKYLQEGDLIDDSANTAVPYRVDNLRWLGMAYEANGESEKACQAYKKAVELGKTIDNYEVNLITGYMVNCH